MKTRNFCFFSSETIGIFGKKRLAIHLRQPCSFFPRRLAIESLHHNSRCRQAFMYFCVLILEVNGEFLWSSSAVEAHGKRLLFLSPGLQCKGGKKPDKHCPYSFWCFLLQSRVKLLERITEEHEQYSANVSQFQSWLSGVTERLNCCIREERKSSAEDKLKALKVLKQYNSNKEIGLSVLYACTCFSNHTRVYFRKELTKIS